jgi:hypothetical protein
VAGCCEYDDEPTGSGATELLILSSHLLTGIDHHVLWSHGFKSQESLKRHNSERRCVRNTVLLD